MYKKQRDVENLKTAKGKGRELTIRIDNEAEVLQIENWIEENLQSLLKCNRNFMEKDEV